MNVKGIVFHAWNLITDGSMTAELRQEKDIVRLSIDSHVASVDIEDVKHPLILGLKDIVLHGVGAEEGEGVKLRKPSAIKNKKDNIRNVLSKAEHIAGILAENKKTVILKHQGKELLKIGEGAKSLLPVLRKKHIQIPNKFALLRFLIETG
jgi:hypothetical protein